VTGSYGAGVDKHVQRSIADIKTGGRPGMELLTYFEPEQLVDIASERVADLHENTQAAIILVRS
jgi:hypothetical protein